VRILKNASIFRRLTIGKRLGLCLGLLLVLTALQTGFAIFSRMEIDKLNQKQNDIQNEQKRKVYLARELNAEVANLAAQYLLLLDFPVAPEFKTLLNQRRRTANDALAALVDSSSSAAFSEQVAQTRPHIEKFNALLDRILLTAEKGKGEEAIGLWARDGATLQAKYRGALDLVLQAMDIDHASSDAMLTRRKEQSNSIVGFLLGCSLLLIIILGWRLTKSITVPLAVAVHASETVARGVLDVEFCMDGSDESAMLLQSLGKTVATLRSAIGQIQEAAEAIQHTSVEIAEENNDLSRRTEYQSANLAKIAQAIDQLASTVKQNDASVSQAASYASSAADTAKRGGGAVASVVETMRTISDSSKKIGDIINVINSISFQTNVLALNAAVEVARAGEHGRGFSIVAEEFRRLAQRTTSEAHQIQLLITAAMEQVAFGSRQVDVAGKTMDEIVRQISDTKNLIGVISKATLTQSSSVTDVHRSMESLDDMTRKNVALVGESASVVESLNRQTAMLAEAVSVFSL
jgi:methyl-accepting chemotaxis protein